MSLERDYDLNDVATALGMSERWVRQRVKEGAEHQRYGNKIKFTAEQVERLRQRFAKVEGGAARSITTGKRKRPA